MPRQIALLTAACLVISCFISQPSAAHDSPLYEAAKQYREAVRQFERQAIKSRHLPRYQERIVDDLEDETSRLRSAARREHRSDRLASSWRNVQSLQRIVGVEIFSDPNCPAAVALSDSWYRVLVAYESVARQLPCCGPNHVQVQPVMEHAFPIDAAPPVENSDPNYGPSIVQPVAPAEEHAVDDRPATEI